MSKKGKKYQEVSKLVDRTKIYSLDEVVALLPRLRTAKFDETIEACIKLNCGSEAGRSRMFAAS